MAETHDRKNQIHNFHFNQNKIKPNQWEKEKEKEKEEEKIELSLGLSLNGHFGPDPTRPNMFRSSSVSVFDDVAKDGGDDVALWRTRSVPTEERKRRREEEQAARRKRVGKMVMMREKGRKVGGPIGERHVAVLVEGQPINLVENISANARIPQSLPDQNESKQTAPIGETKTDKLLIKSTKTNTKEMMKNMMVDMPCVSTRVVGPNGKRIDGFLYRYKKGEEVRIVCVCHGSFLTPAEFVKHAGGGDVAHPLKHIVVNPSSLL